MAPDKLFWNLDFGAWDFNFGIYFQLVFLPFFQYWLVNSHSVNGKSGLFLIFAANHSKDIMTGKDLRIVFMGTPDFAVASLKALVEGGYNIVGVITVPDKPAGRGRQLQQSAVKQYAVEQGLHVMQPEKLKNPEFLAELEALKADLQVIVAFRMLPEVVWSMPRLGTFNLHGSLLPQYRGAAPLNWAVMNGDKETGVTTFLLSHEIDTGAILFHEKITIGEDDTVGDIHDRLMEIGAGLVVKTVDALAEGNYTAVAQDDIQVESLRPAPKIFKEDCKIDWNKPAVEVRNLIRGLSPYPAAWTELVDGKGKVLSLKIFRAEIEPAEGLTPGMVETDGKTNFKIAAADGWLTISDLQLSGKKRMAVDDFLRGIHDPGQLQVQ
ncbi:methionyl-tRNA formyltransferase [Mangrovibacterium diazotrophicum]|uniref:Methionyl-tRNA formyltransferase n=2 Tax=Mangrovibacterium diazotrophicum TaxID=1261403 RepID=A0A419VWU1_9BACT|nr:methionyl-tRNA formyltransferase [Mangrovibacterium diazotrophicum]